MQPRSARRAKELRKTLTWAERKLWSRLRNQQLGGFKFRRQHPLGVYVFDFYCAFAKLAVELDGDPHGNPERGQADASRDDFVAALGIKTLRFWNNDVRDNLAGVLEMILGELEQRKAEAPSP